VPRCGLAPRNPTVYPSMETAVHLTAVMLIHGRSEHEIAFSAFTKHAVPRSGAAVSGVIGFLHHVGMWPGDDHADTPPSMVRPSLLREPPATERGLRPRAALVAAARKVFERLGYLDSRLIDITRAANCSTGTFYTYFSSKEDIFAAVLEVAQEGMLHPGMPHVASDDSPAAVIEASNRAYLKAYKRNAKLMGLLEQVANIDPEFRELRTSRSNAFVRRKRAQHRDTAACANRLRVLRYPSGRSRPHASPGIDRQARHPAACLNSNRRRGQYPTPIRLRRRRPVMRAKPLRLRLAGLQPTRRVVTVPADPLPSARPRRRSCRKA
jgi:AcrR family transcriptional regulator